MHFNKHHITYDYDQFDNKVPAAWEWECAPERLQAMYRGVPQLHFFFWCLISAGQVLTVQCYASQGRKIRRQALLKRSAHIEFSAEFQLPKGTNYPLSRYSCKSARTIKWHHTRDVFNGGDAFSTHGWPFVGRRVVINLPRRLPTGLRHRNQPVDHNIEEVEGGSAGNQCTTWHWRARNEGPNSVPNRHYKYTQRI